MAGRLVKGQWKISDVATTNDKGSFERETSHFRSQVGPESNFPAEKDRYHLYVSYACPWAHRTLLMRSLKGLEETISVDVVHPHMLENGWEFSSDYDGATKDTVEGKSFLYEIYQMAKPEVSGKVTVPVLWDKKQQTIVNNESSEIIRILNSAFQNFAGPDHDYYPSQLQNEIDDINKEVYADINNGVYRCGFAKTQNAYEEAFDCLFQGLENIEKRLKVGAPTYSGTQSQRQTLDFFLHSYALMLFILDTSNATLNEYKITLS